MIDPQLQSGLRAWARAAIPATAHAVRDDKILSSYRVENLSAGGALLSGDPPLVLESEYRLILNLPDSRPIALTGRVVRQHVDANGKKGYGIAFQGTDADTEDYIHNVILSHLENQPEPTPSILVVDDCANVRHAIKRELRSLGMSVVLAAMPLDALRLLLDKGIQIEVAIVDLFLGSADGFQLLKYLETEHPHIRRILISGHPRACQLDLAVSTGHAHAVLPKPWDREQIARAIAV